MRHITKPRKVEDLIVRSARQRWIFIIGLLTRHTMGNFGAWRLA